jgi:hypothetical protein
MRAMRRIVRAATMPLPLPLLHVLNDHVKVLQPRVLQQVRERPGGVLRLLLSVEDRAELSAVCARTYGGQACRRLRCPKVHDARREHVRASGLQVTVELLPGRAQDAAVRVENLLRLVHHTRAERLREPQRLIRGMVARLPAAMDHEGGRAVRRRRQEVLVLDVRVV